MLAAPWRRVGACRAWPQALPPAPCSFPSSRSAPRWVTCHVTPSGADQGRACARPKLCPSLLPRLTVRAHFDRLPAASSSSRLPVEADGPCDPSCSLHQPPVVRLAPGPPLLSRSPHRDPLRTLAQ